MMMALYVLLFELGPSPLRLLMATKVIAIVALKCLGLLTGRLLKVSKAQQ